MFKTLFRTGLLLIATLLGILIPRGGELIFLVRYLLVFMLFIVFLQVNMTRMKPEKSHWKIFCANVLIGIFSWLSVLLFSGDKTLALASFFTGIIPTACAAPVVIKFLGGRVEFTVIGFLINTVGVSLALTGLVPLTTGNFTVRFFSQVAGTLVAVVGLPMAGAFLVRKLYKGAQTLAQKLGNVSFLLWNIMLFITVSAAGKSIRETPDMGWKTLVWVGSLSLGICVVNFTVGYWIVPRKLRREGSQVLGQKNTMFLLYIALTYGGPVPALGPTFYVLWQNLWNSFQMYMYDRRKVLRRKKAETSCHS